MRRRLMLLLGVAGALLVLLAGTGAALGMREGHVVVRRVVEGSPAQKAGIQEGDILLSINGVEVQQVRDVVGIVREAGPGQALHLRLLRGDQEVEVSLTLGRRPFLRDRRRGPASLPFRFPRERGFSSRPRLSLCRQFPLLCSVPLDRLVRMEMVVTDKDGEVHTITALVGNVWLC